MTATPPLLELAGISKGYGALRPLRIQQLTVNAAERVALVGMDRVTAEVFVNLVTGAALPDQGRVVAFERATADITDSADWFSVVDRFGIVSERAVLLDAFTTLQNLAMPFSLDVDPLGDALRERAGALADEIEMPRDLLDAPVASLDAAAKMRIRVGRALALEPRILLLEHVSAGLASGEAAALAATLRSAGERRGIAMVAATVDELFARAVATRVLQWNPATGQLAERRGWFGGRLG